MKQQPNRTFVILSFMLAFLFLIGVISVAVLARSNIPDHVGLTSTVLPLVNETTVAQLQQTQTAASANCDLVDIVCEGEATLSPGQQVGVLMASAEATEFADLAQTATAIAQATTPAPYDPTLYAQRQETLVFYTTAAGLPTYVQFYATETAIVSAYQHTATPSNTPLPTTTGTSGPCAFMWARKDLPDVTVLAQIALQMSGLLLDDATVRVEAYGESCGGASNAGRFMAMTTDFYVTIPVSDLSDETLAKQVKAIYWALIGGLEVHWLPARFGYLDITFSHEGETRNLRTMFPEIEHQLELEGAAFIQAVYE